MRRALRSAVVLGLAGVLVAGCAPRDPRERILEERRRWEVRPTNSVQTEDGSFVLDLSVNGPVHAELQKLTVRFRLQDTTGAQIREEWKTLDVSSLHRGESREFTLRFAPSEVGVATVLVDPVPDPTDAEALHIEELQP